MPNDLRRDVMQDALPGAMTQKDKQIQHTIQQRILQTMSDPMLPVTPQIAYLALMNVLGSLLASQFEHREAARLVADAQLKLPLYVEAYRTKEKKL